MDDSCPQTTWTPETEPTTSWSFDGCLGNNNTPPPGLAPGTPPDATPILNLGYSGTLISIVAN